MSFRSARARNGPPAGLQAQLNSLIELECLCCRTSAQTNKAETKRPGQKVVYDDDDDVFHASQAERKGTTLKSHRQRLYI